MEALETRKDDKWHPNRERSSATGTISDIYTYDVVVGALLRVHALKALNVGRRRSNIK